MISPSPREAYRQELAACYANEHPGHVFHCDDAGVVTLMRTPGWGVLQHVETLRFPMQRADRVLEDVYDWFETQVEVLPKCRQSGSDCENVHRIA